MRIASLFALILLSHACARAAECVAPAPDPANTYDAAHTYEKLVRQYPFIRTASDALPDSVRVVANQTYAQQGTRCLQLDLYLPKAQTPRALVVFVHGGGWRSGFRAEFVPMALRLAERGYAAATLSYRLAGEAPYPAAVQDVRAAVRWLRAHAAQFALDPQRFVLAGGSAGGQIASLAGVSGASARFDPDAAHSPVSSQVQAIINIDGLSDFTDPAALQYEDDPKKTPSAAGAWFGGRYAEKAALWAEASPIRYVHAGMPPILFITSGQPRFSVGMAGMRTQMQAVGVESEVLALADAPHSFWLFEPWITPATQAMLDFLQKRWP
ncbi:alpha/beta hydrolase [Massilia sp. TS11]|uniref:alpha/beta hydrolase n=1 Tax=Massilia sp. TS11 TaxID=2908003 RepID=UPI001EDA8039|nr:alpha/beta hydrolase [Massilia sp. TS11]MCG2586804.1 alpha/beta hydrolase [Massilia sp. TS11]